MLNARPHLTMGIPPETYMVVAGFVEFALAFYILTGLALLRLALFALTLIFVAAVPEFGKLDAIGHLPTVAALIAMYLHGPTWVHWRFYHARQRLAVQALKGSAAFVTSLAAFIAAHYGLQSMERSYGAAPQTQAAHVTAAQAEEPFRPFRRQ